MWDMWEEKISGDSETRNWLAANTKPCPKCTKPVEKNGGCNLVGERTRLRKTALDVWTLDMWASWARERAAGGCSRMGGQALMPRGNRQRAY